MKSSVRTLSAVLLAVVFCVPALVAQSGMNLKLQAPFAFQFAGQRFPSGACRMTMPSRQILQLRCGARSAVAMVEHETQPRNAQTGYVLFRKYGDRYFLEEIWAAGGDNHLRVYESKWEKQAARELASKGQAPTRVELALLNTAPEAKH